MTSFCERLIGEVGTSIGHPDLLARKWCLVVGKAGPNAVVKIVISAGASGPGYVVNIARHAETQVIRHEAGIIRRLSEVLSYEETESLPAVITCRQFEGTDCFVVPLYDTFGVHRIFRWINRRRRWRWAGEWLIALGHKTLSGGLSPRWLEREYLETIERIQKDPVVARDVKRRVWNSFDTVHRNASRIPGVCCHGDFWRGNILWQRRSTHAVVIDWGAARWPGLPCVDLCRFAIASVKSATAAMQLIRRYCRQLGLDTAYVVPLYDLYNVFVKAEIDYAYATQSSAALDPFLNGRASRHVAELMRYEC